ncbi:MAG: hypothetical protein IPM45_00570 [Acidimicrobiales bacterium]|nr:hypothetical protein [Acidimicrobiales bacterium]
MGRRLLGAVAVWVVGGVVLFTVVLPPERCGPADPAAVRGAALAAVRWIERAQRPDGTYVYEYDRRRGVVPGYNVVRHAGVTMALYQAAAAGHPTALAAADRGLAWMLDRLVPANGGLALRGDGGDVPLGASALLLAGLALRRQATGEPEHDGLLRDLGRFVVGQQRDDGGFLAGWSDATGRPVPGVTSKYFTGEAFWALALAAGVLPREGWAEPAGAAARYLAEDRDRLEGFVPGVPDHWAAYGLAEPATLPLSEAEAAYATVLAGRFGLMVRGDAQRTGEGLNRWVRWYPARGGGLGTVGEALGALWRLSGRDDRLRDLQPLLAERLGCAADLLADRQIGAADAAGDADPRLAEGAWFYRGATRMDDQQHALSALLAALEAGGEPLADAERRP